MNKAKQKKLAADLKGFNVESILSQYEKLAGKMLREKKYPATLKKLWTRDDLPEDIKLLRSVLSRASNVRDCIQKNEAESAALNALQLAYDAWAAQMPSIWREYRIGKKSLDGLNLSRELRQSQARDIKREVLELAEDIRERNPNMSIRGIARQVFKRMAREEDREDKIPSIEAIRKYIAE